MSDGLAAALDLLGVFVFALSGALLAIRKRMDVFGIGVLSLAAGLGGGVLRDVLIGVTPPRALGDSSLLLAAISAAVAATLLHPKLGRIEPAIVLFDALGLGLFTVDGTGRALEAGLGPLPAVLLGIGTGVGGGVLRDVLANEVPFVLEREIYALAALAGAALVVASHAIGLAAGPAGVGAAAATTAIRLLAVRRGWHAPRAPGA